MHRCFPCHVECLSGVWPTRLLDKRLWSKDVSLLMLGLLWLTGSSVHCHSPICRANVKEERKRQETRTVPVRSGRSGHEQRDVAWARTRMGKDVTDYGMLTTNKGKFNTNSHLSPRCSSSRSFHRQPHALKIRLTRNRSLNAAKRHTHGPL